MLAETFNQALSQAIAAVEQSYGVKIAEVNLFSLSQPIAKMPEDFGFSKLSEQLIQQPDPVNPEQYFWWDEVHPTTQVHQLVSDAIAVAVRDRFPSFREAKNPS
jgi:phospholipase/lecithinase/hemolysin